MAKKEKKKSSFLTEFKTFIARGNVIDMAVGVVIGGAFTAIVNQLVSGIINPCIGKLFGGIDLSELKTVLTPAAEDGTGEVAIMWGLFIAAIINFILVALCVFLIIRTINKVKDAMEKKKKEKEKEEKEEEKPAEPSEEILLLREIRDSLKKE